jgi:5,10-methenyltetrahydrofolate synthetase
MPDTTSIKSGLRRQLLADRHAIAAEVRQAWDNAIGERLLAWWRANPAVTLGIYWPICDEPDLRPAYDELARQGVQLALPMVAERHAPLRFAAWKPGDVLVRDAHGVPVPQQASIPIHPDALLVPCVGFNTGRIRLGYGGGFYDRTLAVDPRPLAVGIAYASSLADFAGEPHDIPLDDVITECSPLTFAPLSL